MIPERLRDAEDFEQALRIAGEGLELDPAFVEKDHWVTQVLRSLVKRYGVSIVFKGGTSLSKGYGLIERFSEDVDILVRPREGATVKTLEGRLQQMSEDVANDLGLTWFERRSPTRGRFASRGDVIVYDELIAPSVDVPREADGVLLEAGYGDGREPSLVVEITPLLCRPLDIDPERYEDTAPFEVSALQPVRTLLEKVVLLHHVASRVSEGDGSTAHERIGRHYHDIDRLLQDPPTAKRLREERDACLTILADIERISAQQYGGFTSRPDDGFCAGPAFSPEGELRSWLATRYDAARDLMPHMNPSRWPSFGETLKRIHRHSDVL